MCSDTGDEYVTKQRLPPTVIKDINTCTQLDKCTVISLVTAGPRGSNLIALLYIMPHLDSHKLSVIACVPVFLIDFIYSSISTLFTVCELKIHLFETTLKNRHISN